MPVLPRKCIIGPILITDPIIDEFLAYTVLFTVTFGSHEMTSITLNMEGTVMVMCIRTLVVLCFLSLFSMQGFSDSEISFAKATFSNLIGGISYFYGQSR